LSNKLLSNIFRFTLSLAFFLDAINVDALFTSHIMIHEEYEGQSSEMYSSHNDKQVILHARFGTTGTRTFQPANNSTRHIYLIDEDSVSLAAQPTNTEEAALLLCRSIRIRHTTLHAPLFDFYSLCKLQI
jgi:hypothetical protein